MKLKGFSDRSVIGWLVNQLSNIPIYIIPLDSKIIFNNGKEITGYEIYSFNACSSFLGVYLYIFLPFLDIFHFA